MTSEQIVGPDPTLYTRMEITVCLACADGDCHTCYGDECECRCNGEESGTYPVPADAPTCPDCGARHDPTQCGGAMCDCCVALEKAGL